MLVHEQLTISHLCFLLLYMYLSSIQTCVVVMHVQLQLCIFATRNLCNSYSLYHPFISINTYYYYTIMVTLLLSGLLWFMYAGVHAHSMLLFVVQSHLYTYYTQSHATCNQTESLHIVWHCVAIMKLLDVCAAIMKTEPAQVQYAELKGKPIVSQSMAPHALKHAGSFKLGIDYLYHL